MSRKTTVILIVIIDVIVLALGIFLLFFTSPPIQNTNSQSNNSPFGSYTGSSSTTPVTSTTGTGNESSTSSSTNVQYINNPTSPLLKISTAPIAGAEVFDRKVTATTSVSIARYIERATGHTYEYDRSTGALSASSNTTIPSIYQAVWSGNTVL